jgi:hypothetical protein
MFCIIEFEVLAVNHFRSACSATIVGESPSHFLRVGDFPRPNFLRPLTKGLPLGLSIAADHRRNERLIARFDVDCRSEIRD